MSKIPSRDEALFADALAQPPAQRGAFLAQACGANVDLLAHLVALVAAHESPESLTISPPRPVHPELAAEEKPGDVIGRYKLLQKIGEGGCGVVWMAEQEEPVRRRVALKVIKLGMDTKAVVARFEAERQALAMMDHPNIAKVHDAGSTDTGRPYFVMELVRGIPITKYCDENHLTPKERLELFIKVCQAIQHAHQKGVIHRDIKPSNILVTVNDGAPTPKVIDFGIAKATQGKLTDATVFTAFEQFIGTPVYMSPEQAEMSSLDIDTRSDIYSLGVLLYELLTGRPPFDPKTFAQAGVDQIRQQIREREPAKPSRRLGTMDDDERTTIAKLRNTAPVQLSLLLRGDLDWIVMRCLEKDRTRRYDTANGLAMDIHRHLRNEPVVARPPSTAYLLQKLVRRHRLAFAAGAIVAVALVIATVVSTRHRTLAEDSRGEAEKLVGFLLEEFYDELAPTGRLETVARLAERAVAYYDRLPAALLTPETERHRATALTRQGAALMMQGNTMRWIPVVDRAITELEKLRVRGDTSEETTIGLARALATVGWARFTSGRSESGAAELDRAITLLRPVATAPGSSRRAQWEFANILDWSSHQQPKARGIVACEEARRTFGALGALDMSDLRAASGYADASDSAARQLLAIGRIDDADRLEREALAMVEEILLRVPNDLRAMFVRALAHNVIGLVEARRFYPERALEWAAKYAGAMDTYSTFDPSNAAAWRNRLGSRRQTAQALLAQGRVAEAEKQLRAAIALGDKAPLQAAARWPVPSFWLELAAIAAQRGDRGAAEQALGEATRVQEMHHREFETGEFGRLLDREFVEQARRVVRLCFREYEDVDRTGAEARGRIEALAKDPDVPMARKEDIDGLRREALIDSAKAALRLGRFSDAEQAASAAARGPQGNGTWANLETNRAFAQALLALAIARQGRGEEAHAALAPALRVYRDLKKKNADGVDFSHDFAFCLYAHAVACAGTSGGRVERSTALDEAAQLLTSLSDEAKALRDVHDLIESIATERAKQKDKS